MHSAESAQEFNLREDARVEEHIRKMYPALAHLLNGHKPYRQCTAHDILAGGQCGNCLKYHS